MPSKISQFHALYAEYVAFAAWAETVSSLSVASMQASGTTLVDGVSSPQVLTGQRLAWFMAATRENGVTILTRAVKIAKAEVRNALAEAKAEANEVIATPEPNGGA